MAINMSKTVSSLTYNGTELTLAPNITDFSVFKSGVNDSLHYYY